MEQSDYEFEKISGILKYHSQIKLFRARSLAEAAAMLGQRRFDLIFASSFLPDGNAIDLMRTVNENERNIPVVVFTGKDDDLLTAQMLQAGALEYIPKGRIGEKALTRIITNVMEKARLQREVRELEQKVLRLTRRDELTGLFNRRYLEETLDNEIARARRYRTDLVLCIMDLDRFRRVNQTHSRLAGDSVLVEVAGLLKRLSRQCDNRRTLRRRGICLAAAQHRHAHGPGGQRALSPDGGGPHLRVPLRPDFDHGQCRHRGL